MYKFLAKCSLFWTRGVLNFSKILLFFSQKIIGLQSFSVIISVYNKQENHDFCDVTVAGEDKQTKAHENNFVEEDRNNEKRSYYFTNK